MSKKRYKKLKYHQSRWIFKMMIVLLLIMGIAISLSKWINLKGLITISSIGVLSLIAIALVRWERIKYAFLIEKFITSNDLLQYHLGTWGKKKIDYYPNITYKVENNGFFVRFRLDGSHIGERLYDLERPLENAFQAICTDIIHERGFITYLLEIKKPEQQIIHSLEELPQLEHGVIQIGNMKIAWKDKLFNFLITGRTGSGKTELVKQIMYLLKCQNVRLVYCDPKNDEAMFWFCKQHDIRYFSTENDIAKTVREFEESMLYREQDLKNMNLTKAPFNGSSP